jgi:Tfp pilus assembly protein FimT
MLIVMAVIGILAAIGFVSLRTPGPQLFANDLRALVQQARHEAVKRNVPVAVRWDASGGRFVTTVSATESACGAGTELAQRSLAEYPRLTIATTFVDGEGVVWLPSGQARSCTLRAFDDAIATIGDGRTQRTVIVTLTGRVEIE